MVDLVRFGLPDDYYGDQSERLQAVTLAEVRAASARHVDPDALSIVVVGDRAAIEASLRELGPPVVALDYDGQPVT